ncbi:hypothetical protein AB0948_30225 [Streptomyces koyangensis]|uniref:hypothetical protein n=1 Tax=Streptomyces koyangensis TaxID=188770 RepID=UPI0034561464
MRWPPLRVPRLASPAAMRALLPHLLSGHEDDVPASTEEWREHHLKPLAQRLAAADRRSPGGGRG